MHATHPLLQRGQAGESLLMLLFGRSSSYCVERAGPPRVELQEHKDGKLRLGPAALAQYSEDLLTRMLRSPEVSSCAVVVN